MHRNELLTISIVVQCIGIALLIISILVQCIGIALFVISIVVQCIGIAILTMSMVFQCIGIKLLTICIVVNKQCNPNALYHYTYRKQFYSYALRNNDYLRSLI